MVRCWEHLSARMWNVPKHIEEDRGLVFNFVNQRMFQESNVERREQTSVLVSEWYRKCLKVSRLCSFECEAVWKCGTGYATIFYRFQIQILSNGYSLVNYANQASVEHQKVPDSTHRNPLSNIEISGKLCCDGFNGVLGTSQMMILLHFSIEQSVDRSNDKGEHMSIKFFS